MGLQSNSLRKHLLSQQQLSVVLCKRSRLAAIFGGVAYRIIGAKADKPAVERVVLELLEQPTLGADPVERLQQ